MSSRCSIYVDTGYLLASAATKVTGTSYRNGITVNYPVLVERLMEQAHEFCGLPVLRVHWYDSAYNAVPDLEQQRIGELPRVKLRLGRFGVDGQQKGVDLRIGLDLVTHARNGAAEVFFLVSGDDDLTEAVEEAQIHGVRVVLLAVPNADGKPQGVSRHLLRAADELVLLDAESINATVSKAEVAPSPVKERSAKPGPIPKPMAPGISPAIMPRAPRPAPQTPSLVFSGSPEGVTIASDFIDPTSCDKEIDTVVTNVLETLLHSAPRDEVADLADSRPQIPAEIDRALLRDLCEMLGIYDLNNGIRYRLRDKFWKKFDEKSGQ